MTQAFELLRRIKGNADGASWEQAQELAAGDAHVWTLPLELDPEVVVDFESTLSSAERERAARYRFQLHRRRFIAGRGLVRAILAAYTGVAARAVQFTTGFSGKPELIGRELRFNVSHSEDLALLAISLADSVGVDVERVRPIPEADELVKRFFSPNEAAVFFDLPSCVNPEAFFNLWTRKEAWLKATGEGIGHALHLARVSFVPGEPAKIESLPHEEDPAGWSLRALRPAPGFTAALVVSGELRKVVTLPVRRAR